MEQKDDDKPEREYDKTGFYPPDGGKAFRVWALLAWLTGVMVAIALVAALINNIVLG
jgi:hypothetical protein